MRNPDIHAGTRVAAPRRAVRGAALATALILLLVLTLLGVSALNTVMLEERMAGNLRDQILALGTTENAILQGENLLGNSWMYGIPGTADCSNGLCDATNGSPFTATGLGTFEDNVHNDSFWATNSQVYSGPTNNASKPVYYFIERLDYVCSALTVNCEDASRQALYRITARGVGADPNTISVIQVTYARDESQP